MRVLKQISTDKILAWMSDATDGTLTVNERTVPSNDLQELDMPSGQLRKAWRKQEEANLTYSDHRVSSYPSIPDQLDYIYHNGIEKWKTDMILPVKEKYPKGDS